MSEKKNVKPLSKKQYRPNRRQFLGTSGSAVLAGAAVFNAASSKKVLGANNRVRFGVIGCGGMGTHHISLMKENDGKFGNLTNAEVSAVSDIYEPRKERAAEISGAKVFHDYRKLLDSGLVDGVIIAVPEHWHYRMAIDARDAGVDVYLQKPMTRTYEEARSLYRAFSKSDRIFQLGSQYFQSPSWKRAKQLHDAGHLGHVTMVQTSYCRNSREGEWNYEIDEGVEPGKNLDWKAFMGPLPYDFDYDPEYYFRWRKYRAFSGGIITDLMPHKVHCLAYVLGAEYPKKVSAVGGIYVHPDRDVADTTVVTMEFDSYTLIFAGATSNEIGLEDLLRGHQGNLYVGGNSVRMIPERVYSDEFDVIDERIEPSELSDNELHMQEWIDSIRSRKAPTWSIEPAFKVMAASAMAEQSLDEGRTCHFDAEKLRIT